MGSRGKSIIQPLARIFEAPSAYSVVVKKKTETESIMEKLLDDRAYWGKIQAYPIVEETLVSKVVKGEMRISRRTSIQKFSENSWSLDKMTWHTYKGNNLLIYLWECEIVCTLQNRIVIHRIWDSSSSLFWREILSDKAIDSKIL